MNVNRGFWSALFLILFGIFAGFLLSTHDLRWIAAIVIALMAHGYASAEETGEDR